MVGVRLAVKTQAKLLLQARVVVLKGNLPQSPTGTQTLAAASSAPPMMLKFRIMDGDEEIRGWR